MHTPNYKPLIEMYQHVDQARDLLEEYINYLGSHSDQTIADLPEDIQALVRFALQLKPEQRRTLMLFLESLKEE